MIEWIKVEDELPADDLVVLLCDHHGHVYIGIRDDHGYHKYLENIDSDLSNIKYWSYITYPNEFNNVLITHDDWIQLAAKQGMLGDLIL